MPLMHSKTFESSDRNGRSFFVAVHGHAPQEIAEAAIALIQQRFDAEMEATLG